ADIHEVDDFRLGNINEVHAVGGLKLAYNPGRFATGMRLEFVDPAKLKQASRPGLIWHFAFAATATEIAEPEPFLSGQSTETDFPVGPSRGRHARSSCAATTPSVTTAASSSTTSAATAASLRASALRRSRNALTRACSLSLLWGCLTQQGHRSNKSQ